MTRIRFVQLQKSDYCSRWEEGFSSSIEQFENCAECWCLVTFNMHLIILCRSLIKGERIHESVLFIFTLLKISTARHGDKIEHIGWWMILFFLLTMVKHWRIRSIRWENLRSSMRIVFAELNQSINDWRFVEIFVILMDKALSDELIQFIFMLQ